MGIDEPFREVRQLLVSAAFLVQGLLEQLSGMRVAECRSESARCTVICDLDMLNPLRGRDQPCITHVRVNLPFEQALGFLTGIGGESAP